MKAFHENRDYNNNIPISCNIIDELNLHAHWHDEVEIIFITKGCLKIGINTDVYEAHSGSFTICCGKDIHYINSVEKSTQAIVLLFKAEILNDLQNEVKNYCLKHKHITPELLTTLNVPLEIIEQIQIDLTTTLIELRNKEPNYEYILKSKILEIVGLIFRYIPTTSSDMLNDTYNYYYIKRMQNILRYLEEHCADDINLDIASSKCNLSKYHFSRLFNNIVGENLPRFINTLRIDKAKKLLKNNDLTISYIALECGFKSIRSFNRTFKKLENISPSNFRHNRNE